MAGLDPADYSGYAWGGGDAPDPTVPPDPGSAATVPEDPTTTQTTSVTYNAIVPAATVPAGFVPDKAVVKGLQNAINRFWGVAIGAPISVDGVVGNETTTAIRAIMAYMPSDGYDTSILASLIGDSPTAASIALAAAQTSDVLDLIADDKGYTNNVSGVSPPSVPMARSATTGLRIPTTYPSRGKSQIAATTFLGLGLPNWVFYLAGGAIVLGVVALVIKHKRGLDGVDDAGDDYGDDEDDYDHDVS